MPDKGDLPVATSAGVFERLPVAVDGRILVTDAAQTLGVKWSTVAGVAAHDLLDGSVDQDTLAGSVVRGDIVVGNSTPKWARVAKGAAGSVLYGDGTDTAWTISPNIRGHVDVGTNAVLTGGDVAGQVNATRLALWEPGGVPLSAGSILLNSSIYLNREDSPLISTTAYVYLNGGARPNGSNVGFTTSLYAVAIRPTANDSANFIGHQINLVHDSGVHDLTGALIGFLAYTEQSVASSTVSDKWGFFSNNSTSAGSVTTAKGYHSRISGGGSAIGTFTHYDMDVSSYPTALTTHQGLNVPNLGNAAVTNAIGIDIAAQSGAVTLNFGLRNASNSVQAGYARYGAVTVPTNVTDGDISAVRVFVATVSGSITNAASGTLTLTGTTNATKGKVLLGSSAYDEVNDRLGVNVASPSFRFTVKHGLPSGFTNAGGDFATMWQHSDGSNFLGIAGQSSSAAAILMTNGGYQLSLGTSGNRYLDIDTGGLVGIGTTSPGIKLDVRGSSWISTYLRVGASSAPANTTAGDLTAKRALLGTDTLITSIGTNDENGSADVLGIVASTVSTSAPSAAVWVSAVFAPTAASSSQYRGYNIDLVMAHTGGAATTAQAAITGAIFYRSTQDADNTSAVRYAPLVLDAGSPATGGTIGLVEGFFVRGLVGHAGKTAVVTSQHAISIALGTETAGASYTIGTAIGLLLTDSSAGATITTSIGIDIPSLAVAATNIGIRNASSYRGTGYLSLQGAGAPSNITDGDLTAKRLLIGTDATLTTYDAGAFILINKSVTPPAGGGSLWSSHLVVTPNGSNDFEALYQFRAFVEPSANDSGAFYGMAYTMNHDSGAHNLTGSLIGTLSTVVQGVAATTVTNMIGVLSSMAPSAGTITNLAAYSTSFSENGSTTVGTLHHFEATMGSFPAGGLTTNVGLVIPNLGNALVTNAIGVDIAAQTSAVTLNFGLRNASNSVQTGYARFGAVTAPTNVTDGDVTLVRLFVGNNAAVNSALMNFITGNRTPAATMFTQYNAFVYTPNGANADAYGLRNETYVRPSAADSAAFYSASYTTVHDSGAFNLTNGVIGLHTAVSQGTASTTITNQYGLFVQNIVYAGTSTNVRGVTSQIVGSGGTAITVFTHYDIFATNYPTALTSHIGFNIPNLGNAAVTNAIGIDIATQSGAATINLGIRNAASEWIGGYLRVGAVSAPTNTTAGDLTAIRLFATGLSFFGGQTTPAAFVDVAASVTGNASLRIRSGTAPTSPGEGDIWNDSTQQSLAAYIGALKQFDVRVGAVSTTDVTVSNTTTETSLFGTVIGTLTLPANFLVVGKTIRIRARGYFSTDSPAHTLRFRWFVGGSAISGTGAQTPTASLVNRMWEAEVEITCRSTGATGSLIAQGYFVYQTGGVASPTGWEMLRTATIAVDTTGTLVVDFKSTWGAGVTATDSITCTNAYYEILA